MLDGIDRIVMSYT